MFDKIFAPIAMAMFLVFIGFLAVYVNSIDLWIVIVVVSAMAIFDFWQSLRGANGEPNG